MSEEIQFLLNLIVPVLALMLFFFIGRTVESRHYRRLEEQEEQLKDIIIGEVKSLPPNWNVAGEPVLVYGSVVLANDYYKVFVSALKKIIGGHLTQYERLVERGRREAIIRMKQMAREHGCNVVWNFRIETAMMQDSRRASSSAEVYAYGTGMRVE